MRRFLRWAAVLVVLGGIVGGIVYANTRPTVLENAQAAAAAERLGCGGGTGEITELANEGRDHVGVPPDYAATPAASGPHNSATYQGPPVIEDPVGSEVEFSLVHNLEHAYVLLYYRADGPSAVDESIVDELTSLAQDETKVITAPYPDLPEGTSLAFVAWTKRLDCPEVDPDRAQDVRTVAEGFIEQYRGSTNAPEPNGA